MAAEQRSAFRPLKVSTLQPDTGFQHPYYFQVNPVKVGSSALEVMTDLKFMPAATCSYEIGVAEARQTMIARGVRLLLVTNQLAQVVGLITARDLAGSGAQHRSMVHAPGATVFEVMTCAANIEVLEFDDVLHAHVGDIIETLKDSGRQHALVVDHQAMDNHQKIRGIFSASQIARQLGIVTSDFDLAGTFAELDVELRNAEA
jgi:CBS-domain-containing membrane protein